MPTAPRCRAERQFRAKAASSLPSADRSASRRPSSGSTLPKSTSRRVPRRSSRFRPKQASRPSRWKRAARSASSSRTRPGTCPWTSAQVRKPPFRSPRQQSTSSSKRRRTSRSRWPSPRRRRNSTTWTRRAPSPSRWKSNAAPTSRTCRSTRRSMSHSASRSNSPNRFVPRNSNSRLRPTTCS